jgi:heavy metal sensor kinase
LTRIRRTISVRLTAWFGGIFLLGWVMFGAAMWFNLKYTLTSERRATVSRRLDRLEELVRSSQSKDPASRERDFKDFARATGGGLVEVIRSDGSQLYPPPAAASAFPWPMVSAGNETFVEVRRPDQPYWVLTRPFLIDGQELYLRAGSAEANNLLVLDRFWQGLLASAPVLLIISSAGGFWLSRSALRPVDRITAMARSISIRNLSERLPETKSNDELERLTSTLNAMLARLDSAVNQIKQFTADASHDLRGPLSFVRTVSEVSLRNPKLDETSRTAFQDIVEEVAKASVLLEDMLTLARAEAERGDIVLEQLDLADVVQRACDVARPLAVERGLALSTSIDSSKQVTVLGDFASLRRLMWVLLDNALKYTPSPGQIHVVLSTSSRQATVTVRDTGTGISEKDLPRIFDRFYRADPSRSQIEGSGLGLAIAKWIAETHRADLSVSSETGKGTTFQLAIPVCWPSTPITNGQIV